MKYLWYLNLKVSFLVATPPTLSQKFTCYTPLPKAVRLHCAPPLVLLPPPPPDNYCTVPNGEFCKSHVAFSRIHFIFEVDLQPNVVLV